MHFGKTSELKSPLQASKNDVYTNLRRQGSRIVHGKGKNRGKTPPKKKIKYCISSYSEATKKNPKPLFCSMDTRIVQNS